jgi:hypothetical protein
VPAIAVVALAVGVVGWAALGSGADDPPGRGGACPTGRPSAAVDTWTEEVTSTGMPGGPPFAVYHLDVEVVVTNEASAPIVVRSVEVPLVAPPGQPPGVGFPSEVAEVAPGGTTTVEVPMDVVIEGPPMPPTPDSSVRLSAEWASDELVSCPI